MPDKRIVWRSKGVKGYVDGAVTFHEVAPDLTKILLVLEYHPKGLFEHTGNLWRAQGRRARLEMKHYRRHVMTQSLLHPEKVEGRRDEVHAGKVVHRDEAEREQEPEEEYAEEQEEEEELERDYGEEPGDAYEAEPEEGPEEEAAEDEYEDEGEGEAPPEDEYPEYEDEDEEVYAEEERR